MWVEADPASRDNAVGLSFEDEIVANRSRRRFLRTLPAAGLLAWSGHAQEPTRGGAASDSGAEFLTAETQTAIDQGLAFLASKQSRDGGFLDRFASPSVGITAIAGLAFMGAGHQPGRGRYGRQVARIVDFLLASGKNTNGYLVGPDAFGGRFQGGQAGMYNHGFGTLCLAEVCGMIPDPARQKQVREMLEKAIAYTVSAQNRDGGWRYDPNPPVADVSVTVAQMMALRAAKNAGLYVRKNVIDQGVKFIRGCQMPDGGFSYFKGQGYSAFARSAAALVGLYSAGIYQGDDIANGLRYLEQFRPGVGMVNTVPAQHYFYGHYYAALAMWTAGREPWSRWLPAIRDELLMKSRGRPVGVWTDESQVPTYATAMALIILQLPNNYLPILQK